MATAQPQKPPFWKRRTVLGATIGSALAFFIVGILFWGGFNTGMEATNTLDFCISCHEMEENVYKEYQPTIHYSNRTGVRATCPDCHVPKDWTHKMIRKIQASNELLHKALGTVDTPEKFDEHRLTMAKRVWTTMKETDSRECRNCHNFESMNPAYQKPRARKQHLNAFETGQTCIDCHKGIAHKDVREQLSEEEIEALEKPNPAFIRPVPQMYADGMKAAETAEAEEKAKKAEADKSAKAATDKAVADALAKAAKAAPVVAAAPAADDAAKSSGPCVDCDPVTEAAAEANQAAKAEQLADNAGSTDNAWAGWDWGSAPEREITLFYPGQSSLEWVLTGKDHGGARPVKKGDRCFDCHDQEASDMGSRIVSGEKLEPEATLIPGKRGSIPVKVQASHDDDYLYMRFEWDDTEHTPVPFVDGGKMDADNPMKLAMMFATDDVQYAGQAGCWGTCHHDANGMPDAPEGQEVHKYITESRSEIEIEGKGGKKRGGWDKTKPEGDLQAEMDARHYMDIVRFKSGANAAEDGHILADRIMEGGQGADFDAKLDGGKWVVQVRRKLQSDLPGDVSLAADQVYNFGFAIHDDHTSGRFHHVSLGYKLGFDKEEEGIEINAVKR
ncbi:MAG: NapC/NirT family cytochrome c [Gammaproteobacteria bacterium]|nr:NapC/NirT family cytochrome c [Gammaproteobacteria bacterium]MBU1723959.1 NapC/NirT family cytochrome c [Gammaproteobacteria bacterium]MBU2007152.1 NapC/NirT family cytochrome c [Gammaproteobacteria bacterium]